MVTFLLLLWLIPIIGNIIWDRKGRKPNYLVMFLLRGMAAIVHGSLFGPERMYDYWPVFFFQITSYWLIFEAGLNLAQRRNILHYDYVEKDSGWIDQIFAKFYTHNGNHSVHTFTKGCALVICILSIIVIYERS